MLADIFYWLLNMSIVASVAGVVLLLLRLIPRLPHRVLYPLWVIVGLRLFIPFGPASDFSILQWLPHRTVFVPVTPDIQEFVSAMNMTMAASDYFPIVYKTQTLEYSFSAVSYLWVSVTAILLLFVSISYIHTLQQNRHAIHWKDNLYFSSQVTGPVVHGIVRPCILLPHEYEDRELEYILRHERIHIRRFDNLWRLLGLIVACIHWFNPLAWLFLRCFLTDMELSCDEAVLRKLSAEERAAYAHTLLSSAQRQSLLSSPFGHAQTSNRIRNILSYQKLSGAALLFVCLTAACISLMLLTNAR